MKHTFNTGRGYTATGQIINVEVAEGRLWFYDESRGIAGSLECSRGEHTAHTLETLCLTNYDFGNYRHEPLPKSGQARAGA